MELPKPENSGFEYPRPISTTLEYLIGFWHWYRPTLSWHLIDCIIPEAQIIVAALNRLQVTGLAEFFSLSCQCYVVINKLTELHDHQAVDGVLDVLLRLTVNHGTDLSSIR